MGTNHVITFNVSFCALKIDCTLSLNANCAFIIPLQKCKSVLKFEVLLAVIPRRLGSAVGE